ncbi:hypothetical protein OG792_32745 [Micromonospora sp. NBC_01699]|uniref:hypothetical protein n=1 Tax=Micromonospora sp. NBC_01699 TaxID=2975984 RepID=UPI002E298AED|nr:hypothetical protein [Micromonospora sp. NBC_01699]
MEHTNFGPLVVGNATDHDDELPVIVPGTATEYLSRSVVAELRDHLTDILGDEPEPNAFDELTPADVEALGDREAYVVTAESFPLDSRRSAALKLAVELTPTSPLAPATAGQTALAYAAFLLGELKDYQQAAA